ncbi:MAG: 50S ribosomal protein L24 [candidate division WOR-3 bacterium]|nr:50S ribosomal protein L24 [candidate division WOR-3 bacterium]
MKKLHIRKNDTVLVISGEDKGKQGKVLKIFPEKERALVEGINMVKKHQRARKQGEEGGILTIEAPVDISNLKLVCPKCSMPTKTGRTEYEGRGVRVCKNCGEMIVR